MESMPLVSVPVITYNSSKYVLETLESIKAQTYQNIELVVSDDCSTDNTVEICRRWIEKNKERFVRVEMLESPVNTGVSANGNRAEAACHGEWIKVIAGDDMLISDCIETFVTYALSHPSSIYIFGRIQPFGVNEKRCQEVNSWFDYSFFSMPIEDQIHRLTFIGNCIPASTAFYNRNAVTELGVVNDERISLLEDWPKWINLLRKGVRFHFIDQELVKYRIGGISNSAQSISYFTSKRQVFFYYQYPELLKENAEFAVNKAIEMERVLFVENMDLRNQLTRIRKSLIYQIYSKTIYPIKSLIYKRTRR